MKIGVIGYKKSTKKLAVQLALKCIIPIVVKPFYCGDIKKTTKEERKIITGYDYEKWKDTQ